MAVCEKCWADASLRTISNGKSQYENYCDLLEERKDNPCTMDKQDKTAERGHWIGWLKKRIDLPDAQWQYVDFALRELQDHNESLQAKIKALESELHSEIHDNGILHKKVEALEERLEAADEVIQASRSIKLYATHGLIAEDYNKALEKYNSLKQ